MVFEKYVNAFEKTINKFFSRMVDSVSDTIVEKTSAKLYSFKRQLTRSAIEIMLLLLSVVAILIGAVMFFSRFIATDLVLLLAGVIVMNAVLLTARFN